MNTRRDLMRTTLGGLAAGVVARAGAGALPQEERGAAGQAPVAPGEDAPFQISLAQWSLHRALFADELDPLDFPRRAREAYGIGAVEYVNAFYRDRATDFEYLGELRQRCADSGVVSLLIMIDGEGALGAADAGERRTAVLRHLRWIAAAGFLGCTAVRVNAEGSGDREEHSKRAAESLRELAGVAADYGVSVLVENHGGPSSDGAWLAATLARADHPGVGSLPDFGNFDMGDGRLYDRYLGVQQLMPFAKAVSAKAYAFDDAGDETTIDFRRMLQIVLDAGYRGHVGIEFEGRELDEHTGILRTRDLLVRLRAEFAGER